MAPLSPRVASVHELDNSGRAGHGHLPASGDRLLWRPVNPGKLDMPVSDSFCKTFFFAKTATISVT